MFLGSHLASRWSNLESFIWYTWHLRSGTPILGRLYVMWQLHILTGCWLYYYGTHTTRSDSKTIHKLSLWHTFENVPVITYNKSSTHNDNEDTYWIIDYFQQNILVNTDVFITQQITSNEMNFNSTNPRCWKRLLWTIGALEGPAIVNIESNAGLIIQAEAAYIRTRVGNHRNVRGIDTVASHKW